MHLVHLSILLTVFADADVPLVRLNRCGPVALRVATESIGRPLPISDIEAVGPDDDRKWTFADLQKAANQFGYRTHARKYSNEPTPFTRGKAAAIARVFLSTGESHYVTIVEMRGPLALVDNFPQDLVTISVETLRKKYGWDGSLLFVFTDHSFDACITRDGNVKYTYLSASILFVFAAMVLALRGRNPVKRPTKVESFRRGLTLIEVLVSLGIIGALMALVLPSILSSRGRALRMSCGNNLHQVGLAMSSFESAQNCYPNPDQLPRIARDIPPQNLAIFSPHVGLLPWLDQANIEAQIDFRNDTQSFTDPASSSVNDELLLTSIPVFKCPEDSMEIGGNSYRACTGTSPGLHTTPQIGTQIASLIGWHSGSKTGSRDVTDGLSNTAFFAERVVGDRDPKVFTPYRDVALGARGDMLLPENAVVACSLTIPAKPLHASFAGSTWLYFGSMETSYNHVLEPNSRIVDCTIASSPSLGPPGAFTARSLHPGGVNVLMGDGSLRFISSSIDRTVWRSLGSIAGNEPVSEF